jgi:hypothetical protein
MTAVKNRLIAIVRANSLTHSATKSEEDRRRVLLALLPNGADLLERASLLNMGGYGPMADSLSNVVLRAQARAPGEDLPPATARPEGRSRAKR